MTIASSGTCPNHWGIKDSVAVGEITNVHRITEALLSANRVVNL